MPYEVPDLPYDYAALEPHIDEATMRVHHDKHHQAYVDKANGALEGTEWADKPVEEVLQNLNQLPQDKQTVFRNNGGGHANHSFFWEIMSPDGGGSPSGDLSSEQAPGLSRRVLERRQLGRGGAEVRRGAGLGRRSQVAGRRVRPLPPATCPPPPASAERRIAR